MVNSTETLIPVIRFFLSAVKNCRLDVKISFNCFIKDIQLFKNMF